MNDFLVWAQLGIEHIADFSGYDHMLFLLSLMISYSFRQWKPLLALLSGFTIGHSLTLILSVSGVLSISSAWVELLIPATIFITSLYRIQHLQKNTTSSVLFSLLLTTLFGCIHGLGFSNYLRSLLGSETSLWLPMIAFNLGIELGQLIVVSVLLLFSLFLYRFVRIHPFHWNFYLASAVSGVAFLMMIERASFLLNG
jgi:hypothetical protein